MYFARPDLSISRIDSTGGRAKSNLRRHELHHHQATPLDGADDTHMDWVRLQTGPFLLLQILDLVRVEDVVRLHKEAAE